SRRRGRGVVASGSRAIAGARRAYVARSRAWRRGPRSPGCRYGGSPRRPSPSPGAGDRPSRQLSAVEPSILLQPLELVERLRDAVGERGRTCRTEILLIARVAERGRERKRLLHVGDRTLRGR